MQSPRREKCQSAATTLTPALGARAVGVGRPYAYGLALDGANGAAHVLKCLLAEADLLMAVNGYPTIAAIRAAGAVRVD